MLLIRESEQYSMLFAINFDNGFMKLKHFFIVLPSIDMQKSSTKINDNQIRLQTCVLCKE